MLKRIGEMLRKRIFSRCKGSSQGLLANCEGKNQCLQRWNLAVIALSDQTQYEPHFFLTWCKIKCISLRSIVATNVSSKSNQFLDLTSRFQRMNIKLITQTKVLLRVKDDSFNDYTRTACTDRQDIPR